MQKLFGRIGTEQHKYRLGLQFVSILVTGQNAHLPGAQYRIILQRGSKKYPTQFMSIVPNT